jgi:Fe-S-cluster containining protein
LEEYKRKEETMDINEIKKNIKNGTFKILEKETDTFEFGCSQCGECCINKTDIMVSVWDVVRISDVLNMPSKEICLKFLNFYIGRNSKFPIATLKSFQMTKDISICPFLSFIKDNEKLASKCFIQKDKPFACAMYPLGKITSDKNKIQWIHQKMDCKAKKTKVTLGDWINQYNLEGHYEATNIMLHFFNKGIKLINKINPTIVKNDTFITSLISAMYGSYIPSQKETNVESSKKMLDNTLNYLEAVTKYFDRFTSN